MTRGVVPTPAPRKTRALPWIAVAIASALGLVLFGVLWQVAIDLQAEHLPQPQPHTWESAP